MITVGQIYSYLDQIAPFDYQADWDNSGLQVGSYDDQVDKVLVALDVTSEVIEEAQDMGAQMIVSHHPVLFHAVKRLDRESIPYQLAKGGYCVGGLPHQFRYGSRRSQRLLGFPVGTCGSATSQLGIPAATL